MAYTSLRSDYENFLKERNKNLAGVSEWERLFLQPLTQQYESGVQQIQKQTQYDISQAYSNYKKNQLRLMQSNIDTASQNKISSGLQTEYVSAFNQAQQEFNKNLNTLTQQYQSALQTNQQAIQTAASDLKTLYDYALEKAGLSDLTDVELAQQGYLKYTDSGYEITNKLKNLFQQQWYGAESATDGLEKYIRDNSGLSGEKLDNLIDSLYQNQSFLNETVGLSPTQRSINKELQYAQDADTLTAPSVKGDKGSLTLNKSDFDPIKDWFSTWGGKEYSLENKINKLIGDVEKFASDLGLDKTDIDVANKFKPIIKDATDYWGSPWGFDVGDFYARFKKQYAQLIEEIREAARKKYAQYR